MDKYDVDLQIEEKYTFFSLLLVIATSTRLYALFLYVYFL